MRRKELIEAIHRRVPTASRDFLSQFSAQELAEYLQAVLAKSSRNAARALAQAPAAP